MTQHPVLFCGHKIIEKVHGTYICIDCNRPMRVIPLGSLSGDGEPEPKEECEVPEKKTETKDSGASKWWKPAILGTLAGLLLMGGLPWLGGALMSFVRVPEEKVEVVVESPQETPEAQVVYRDRIVEVPKEVIKWRTRKIKGECPKNETVYVPGQRSCADEIEASCSEYKEALRYWQLKAHDPSVSSARKMDPEPIDDYDEFWDGDED